MSRRSEARDRILERVRGAVERRAKVEHPGPFSGGRPEAGDSSPVDRFESSFRAAGGEVAFVRDLEQAADWLRRFADGFGSLASGTGVPDELQPDLPEVTPHDADLAISAARAAISETGSLVLDARDGRGVQLLSPTHVVVLHASQIHATAREALACLVDDLPSALGIHSGPSKSADIGMVMVKGVHGPGRVVALVVGEESAS